MLRNFLKIAIRNLTRGKGYTVLNILGLAVGMACCLLILQYVAYEKSYDRFPADADRVVRLRLDEYQKGKLAWQSATVYPAIAPAMKKDFPEVQDYCRLIDAEFLFTNPGNHNGFKEEKGYFADTSSLEILGVHLVEGNPSSALDGPDKIILSETSAKKYFGSADPVGKMLTASGDRAHTNLLVTGVFRDYPTNSHLIIHHLVSYATLEKAMHLSGNAANPPETSWGWYDFYAYLRLRPGADWRKLQAKMPAFCDRYMNNKEWAVKNNVKEALYLMPLSDIHLYSNYNQEAEVNGNGKAVGFLLLIALLIIAIAWVNYTNLATARSLERAKEVGVRKVLGAVRGDLVRQFLTESLLLNGTALIVALGAAILLTPSFNTLIGPEQPGRFSIPLVYTMGFLSIFLTGAFLSGIYPAFVLSGYHPVVVLKGLFRNTAKGLTLRKSLIVGQFAVSAVLIAGTILVFQQVRYMRSQPLGANIDQTLIVRGPGAFESDSLYKQTFQPFKTALLQRPDIRSVTASSNVMGQEIYWTNTVNRAGEDKKNAVTLYFMGVDEDFVPAYMLKLAAGRNFSRRFATDKKAVLINAKAAELLGFKNPDDAINGKIVNSDDTLTVAGVLADYHLQGLQKTIDPLLVQFIPDIHAYYSVKIAAGDTRQTISALKTDWGKYFPGNPFDYFFLDESFNEQYKADIRFGQVFCLFAFLAIGIACFGLLGLSAYNVLLRTREIGIRKVLGASVRGLVFILSKEFLWLVLISLIIAIPLTWWVMDNWLKDFAYRISIHWWVFAIAGALSIFIALGTVSIQALKAALANPVGSLRS